MDVLVGDAPALSIAGSDLISCRDAVVAAMHSAPQLRTVTVASSASISRIAARAAASSLALIGTATGCPRCRVASAPRPFTSGVHLRGGARWNTRRDTFSASAGGAKFVAMASGIVTEDVSDGDLESVVNTSAFLLAPEERPGIALQRLGIFSSRVVFFSAGDFQLQRVFSC